MTKQSSMLRTVVAVGLGVLLVATVVTPASGDIRHPGTDSTVTRIDVHDDGSARWSVQIRTHLDSNESIENYEAFQATFRENKSAYLDQFRERIRGIVAGASNATDREMTARNFTAETSLQAVPRHWGTVTYAFTWDGFATQQNDELVVGDAFDSGFYIAKNDSLEIVAPDEYSVAQADPSPDARDDDTLTWEGRKDFTDERPRVRFERRTATSAHTDTTTSTSESGSANAGGQGLVPFLGGALVLALVAGGVGYQLRRGDGTEADAATTPLSDEQRLLQLLEANGGRMKQSDVVDEVEWSKSKVSRQIGQLDEQGLVQKTRIGRENVVELVGDEAADE